MNRKTLNQHLARKQGKSIKNISLTENDKIEKLLIKVLKLKNDNIGKVSYE